MVSWAQHLRETNMHLAEEETKSVYVECKRGWALISGERDDTQQPMCSRARCKEDGEY